MKELIKLAEQGWWIKVSPLATLDKECWVGSVYKRGKKTWVTEDCSDFSCPEHAYKWGWNRVYQLTDGGLYPEGKTFSD